MNSQNQTADQNTTTMTYANKTKQFHYPKGDQGIYMNAIDEINISDYLHALAKYVQPKDIISASRVSNKRICIHLSSKEQVDSLLKERQSILVSDQVIDIRRKIKQTIKIIISNVDITVPNYLIEEKLKESGIKLASGITLLKIGIKNDAFSHILSHRRQCYIVKEENFKIPERITVTHEDLEYKIYVTEDNLRCSNCKRFGHTEANCYHEQQETQPLSQQPGQQIPQQTQPQPAKRHLKSNPTGQSLHQQAESSMKQIVQQSSTQQEDLLPEQYATIPKTQQNPQNGKETLICPTQQQENIPLSQDKPIQEPQQNLQIGKEVNEEQHPEYNSRITNDTNKRTHTEASISDTSDIQDNVEDLEEHNEKETQTKSQRQMKKSRALSPGGQSTVEQVCNLIKQNIKQKSNKYKLNTEDIKNFLENAIGSTDPLNIAYDYTDEPEKLLDMMEDVKQHCNKTTKNNLSRIINKFRTQLNDQEHFEPNNN